MIFNKSKSSFFKISAFLIHELLLHAHRLLTLLLLLLVEPISSLRHTSLKIKRFFNPLISTWSIKRYVTKNPPKGVFQFEEPGHYSMLEQRLGSDLLRTSLYGY